MQDSKFKNIRAMYEYTEWNWEMRNLYCRYSLIEELNQDLMKECPVYAMYTISEYLKRKRVEVERQLKDISIFILGAAGKDPIKVSLALKDIEKKSYEMLKPIIDDYVKARQYFVAAMFKPRTEYVWFLESKDREKEEKKTK